MDSSREALKEQLFRHVDMLAGVIGPRHPGKPHTMSATAGYIDEQFRRCGLSPVRESFSVSNQSIDNVLVTIPGSQTPESVVILGAHYDSTPSTPGADDNASAVAVLLETARLLKEIKPQKTVRFAAFACEESPYFHTDEMGSLIHARGCRSRGENVIGMLCMEMVGYYLDGVGTQQIPPSIPGMLRKLFPSRGNFLAAVGNIKSTGLCWKFRRGFKSATQFPLFSVVLPERIREIHLSDNSAFWSMGYPALMLTDTSFLRNPNYHQWSDTPDTLDYVRMAEVTCGVAAAVQRLSQ